MPQANRPLLPGFRPDPASDRPLYLQLGAALAEAIRAGRIAVGTRLPSERLHAQALGLSRTTVTAAYQELKAAGLVRGHVGRGATVIADDPDGTPAAVAWPLLASRLARPALPLPAPAQAIPLADGWLHPDLAPRAALRACAAKAAASPDLLTRSAPILGSPALREALAGSLRAGGVRASPDEILVTGGAQQGLNVLARALLSPGDAVACESPSWHGAFRAFRAVGAEVAGVATDREGVDPDALEDVLIRLRPKFVYLIPSFHCPTGRLLGLERRRRVLELCARFRTPIVESHVYGDIAFGKSDDPAFGAPPPPSLKSLDEAGIVIQQGSASKTIGAALRLGWLVAPRPAMALLAPAKASLDLSTPALPQAILAEFLRTGAYARHLPRLRAELRTRRDALIAGLAVHAPELRLAAPAGGLYLWAALPAGLAARELETAAADEGVSVRAGDLFLPEGGPSRHIRLCYAAPAPEEIPAGAERLGKALRGLLQRRREPPMPASALAPV
ncbi:aminotransferase-like domain-containing protein [Labrys wisconsinensis]|uniref:DNA-binding transcriptional MocR family regulator n=1 Tax=Labrys wisconsinensis TaxID=425677 RepID=A0ABU0JJ33_9HYPH|nr:PLP-dependent aminotransferase family protein [Labrys wisconsinensis]MDQ0474296.1 DNA-binding transcriptional MocR family regulator [Labrys wisconsinensis]